MCSLVFHRFGCDSEGANLRVRPQINPTSPKHPESDSSTSKIESDRTSEIESEGCLLFIHFDAMSKE